MDIVFKDSSSESGLAELRASANGVVIFGAGRAGRLVLNACRNAGIAVNAFCDNAEAKQGIGCLGLPVLSLPAAVERFPGAKFVMAITAFSPLKAVVAQLGATGIAECYGGQLLERFFRPDAKPGFRDNGHEANETVRVCVAVHRNFNAPRDRIVAWSPSIHLTDKCTLNCRDCGGFMSKFADAENVATQTLFDDIDALCACVDEIVSLGIIGGEPLIHPDFHLVIRHAAQKDNVKGINVFTNGTVVPREEQWRDLRHDKVFLSISDYGELSAQRDRLIARCEERGVRGLVSRWDEWYGDMAGETMGRDAGGLLAHVRSCIFNNCFIVSKQRLYPCGTMLNGVKLGLFPDVPDDSVDLSPALNGGDISTLRKKVRSFLNEGDSFQACDSCRGGGPGRELVKAAIQAERIRK